MKVTMKSEDPNFPLHEVSLKRSNKWSISQKQ